MNLELSGHVSSQNISSGHNSGRHKKKCSQLTISMYLLQLGSYILGRSCNQPFSVYTKCLTTDHWLMVTLVKAFYY